MASSLPPASAWLLIRGPLPVLDKTQPTLMAHPGALFHLPPEHLDHEWLCSRAPSTTLALWLGAPKPALPGSSPCPLDERHALAPAHRGSHDALMVSNRKTQRGLNNRKSCSGWRAVAKLVAPRCRLHGEPPPVFLLRHLSWPCPPGCRSCVPTLRSEGGPSSSSP